MGIFRSEDIDLYQMTMPKDDAWFIMNEVGTLPSGVHFVDLNKGEQTFSLPYASQMRRCDETLRRLDIITTECTKMRIKANKVGSVERFNNALLRLLQERRKAENVFIEDIESEIQQKERFLTEQIATLQEMNNNYNTLLEHKHVISVAAQVIKTAQQEADVQRQNEQEEKKHEEIQLQDFNGVKQNEGTNKPKSTPSANKDQLKEERVPLIVPRGPQMVAFSCMAGTITKEDQMRFKRMIFRATRGRALTYFQDLKSEGQADYAGIMDKRLRTIYVIVFQEGASTRNKLIKISESFTARQVEIPQNFDQIELLKRVQDVEKRIIEGDMIIKQSRQRLRDYLRQMQQISMDPKNKDLNDISLLEVYRTFLQKEKALYSTLNKFKVEEKLYVGYCWIPSIDNEEVLRRIQEIRSKDHNIEIPTLKMIPNHGIKPPTLFRMNDVTWVFQEIVNTYGIPNYKEVNPSVFAIVTFPFLFGIMFGDIGHGFVLFLVGAVLCLLEDVIRTKAPGMEALLGMRYLALLMGLFATFAGLIYNDLMAIPVWIWDSCYDLTEIHHDNSKFAEGEHVRPAFRATFKPDCVYPVGVDPVWHLGSNELTYLNSLKMKLSVILGVLQMGLGVFMKALNARYNKNSVDFWFEFVPQIILLFCLFGWMDMMIIAKWMTDFTNREYMAPSIISTMIDMFLNGGSIPEGIQPIIGSASLQQGLSIMFLLVSLICAPMMLFPKPFIIKKEMEHHAHQAAHDDLHNKQSMQLEEIPLKDSKLGEVAHKQEHEHHLIEIDHLHGKTDGKVVDPHSNEVLLRNEPKSDGGHGTNFADIFIHQLIETIEFVLGTISNTASYLRLWALSLAHGQLAAVFIENTIMPAFEAHSVSATFFGVWIGYFMWVSFTLGVLMSMDVMECFLHTLRLHWVEFQNKFYKGQGYKFTPFNYEQSLKQFVK